MPWNVAYSTLTNQYRAPVSGALQAAGQLPLINVPNRVVNPAAGALVLGSQAPSLAIGGGGGGGGATPIFNFPNFSGSPPFHFVGFAAVSGSQINFTTGVSHQGGACWYNTVQNIQQFTTEFTWQGPPDGYGFVFSIQNSNATTNPGFFGLGAGDSSANGQGYGGGGGPSQAATGNSIGLVFTTSAFNGYNDGFLAPPPYSAVLLCVDGGPAIGTNGPTGGYAPEVDLRAFGLNVGSNNPIHCILTYDGTTLFMVVTDTVTLATARLSWPVNIPTIVGANTAFIGFCANSPVTTSEGVDSLLSWKYSTGFNTRLSTPTFSVTPGQYTGTQSVSLNGPAGASLYYTTNGIPPTTASTQYTGTPISVSASQLVQVVAIQTGFTDSIVAQGLYLIQSTLTPVINFPSGFASANGLVQFAGNTTLSGSEIFLVDNQHSGSFLFEAASAWFAVPVSIATFSTTFTLDISTISLGGSSDDLGVCFVLQNYPQTTTGTNFNWNLGNGPFGVTSVSGGPWALSSSGTNYAYSLMFSSIAVVFDIRGNTIGLYTDGAVPQGSGIAVTGVNFSTATLIAVTIAYNGTALTITMTQGSNTFGPFTLSSSINIPSIVGASSGFAGFMAATGFCAANIKIHDWKM